MIVRTMLVSLCIVVAAAALAQDVKPTAPATQSPPTAAPAKPEANAAEAKKPDAQEPAAPATKPTKDTAGTPQRFIPSEQVRSDFDVSFPVDI